MGVVLLLILLSFYPLNAEIKYGQILEAIETYQHPQLFIEADKTNKMKEMDSITYLYGIDKFDKNIQHITIYFKNFAKLIGEKNGAVILDYNSKFFLDFSKQIECEVDFSKLEKMAAIIFEIRKVNEVECLYYPLSDPKDIEHFALLLGKIQRFIVHPDKLKYEKCMEDYNKEIMRIIGQDASSIFLKKSLVSFVDYFLKKYCLINSN